MSLILVPAQKENLEMSIENPIDISFAREYLSTDFFNNILHKSGAQGIRCWATTKKLEQSVYAKLQPGDEVLFSLKRSGLFTHYGVVIGKFHSLEFGKNLWKSSEVQNFEYIYFLTDIIKIEIEKGPLLLELKFDPKYNLPSQIVVRDEFYSKFGNIHDKLENPSFNKLISKIQSESPSEYTRPKGQKGKENDITKPIAFQRTDQQCCVCGITEKEFLETYYLSYWHDAQDKKVDQNNGLIFCCLHHMAFDHGYFGFDDKYKVIINPQLNNNSSLYKELKQFEGVKIQGKDKDSIDLFLIQAHRNKHKFHYD